MRAPYIARRMLLVPSRQKPYRKGGWSEPAPAPKVQSCACLIAVLMQLSCMPNGCVQVPAQVKQAALGPRHADTANTLFHLAEVGVHTSYNAPIIFALCCLHRALREAPQLKPLRHAASIALQTCKSASSCCYVPPQWLSYQ